MPPRPHDPFNDAPPRRPASRANNHLHETHTTGNGGQTSRTTTTARNLFAPVLSRRPTTTAPSNPHGNDLVLEDSDDGDDRTSRRAAVAAARGIRTRRARAATETTIEPDEDELRRPEPVRELVIRDEMGSFVREVPALGETFEEDERIEQEEHMRMTGLVKEYWASANPACGRITKKWDEQELERLKEDVMERLRETVGKKLNDEQWMYEPTDYMEELRVANHGRV